MVNAESTYFHFSNAGTAHAVPGPEAGEAPIYICVYVGYHTRTHSPKDPIPFSQGGHGGYKKFVNWR